MLRRAHGRDMKRTWTIIGVKDVAASFRYQSLFGQPPTGPAHEEFGQICDDDGTVLLCPAPKNSPSAIRTDTT